MAKDFKVDQLVIIVNKGPMDSSVAKCIGCTGTVSKLLCGTGGEAIEVLLNDPHPHWRQHLYVKTHNIELVTQNGWTD